MVSCCLKRRISAERRFVTGDNMKVVIIILIIIIFIIIISPKTDTLSLYVKNERRRKGSVTN